MFFPALQELSKDYGPTRLANKLNEIIQQKGDRHFTKMSISNWIKGSMPKVEVQDAIIYLYLKEKGEVKIQNLWVNYLKKIMSEFSK